MQKGKQNIFITGGAGYVGAVLVPKLLANGDRVTVYDLLIFGKNVLKPHPNLSIIKGDITNIDLLSKSITNHDVVIHLACISNDPSFELNPKLGKSINLDCFEPMVKECKNNNVNFFIYAS
ncbi:MAG: SDR family oxidoreductase, partial [Pelagibacterales bacterium]|nr:SDR family oxidoreductase [Pelagibacterales bacterium]